MVAIKLHELSKSFQGPVINQLSLTIPDQQITALIGPSGSGKSTLLNMIAGLTTPDSGQISFDNQPIFDAATHWNQPLAQRHLAMVFQDFALWPHMTVQENVAFALEKHLTKPELTAQVNWALEQVSLIDFRHRYPRELSGGQQQRVALARALATQPDLILFDEALSALDPRTAHTASIRNSRPDSRPASDGHLCNSRPSRSLASCRPPRITARGQRGADGHTSTAVPTAKISIWRQFYGHP
nr:ABC transporter ATP-binding protein [Lactiplantibacillus plantarum]